MDHDYDIYADADDPGWVWIRCTCGWHSDGTFPGNTDAIDAWGDHRAAVGAENVDHGRMEYVGVDRAGEPQFRLTDEGHRAVHGLLGDT